jgi:predicted nuclease of predicted toxin-antitoxin system
MRLLLDEDSQGRRLARLLREAGHDVLTVGEARLDAHTDAEVLAGAKREDRVLLTRNVKDFRALHETDVKHPGILTEHQDRDPAKNMSAAEIVRAIGSIEASGWNVAGQFIAINAWNFPAGSDDT